MTPLPDQTIEDDAVLIYGTPQIMLNVLDPCSDPEALQVLV